MSEQYTPTETEMLGWYARGRSEGYPLDPPADYFGDDEWEQEWARFIAQVRAAAWDEGHRTPWVREPDECECCAWASYECGCGLYGTGRIVTPNPYKETDR